MFKLLVKFNFICLFLPLVESNNVDPVTTPRNNQDVVFRVVNGTVAKLGEFPYQVSLKVHTGLRQYANICGGTVIGENKILSAAHCFEKKGNVCQRLCKKVQKKELKNMYAVVGCLKNRGRKKKDKASSEQWRRMTGAFFPKGYWFPKQDIAIARPSDVLLWAKLTLISKSKCSEIHDQRMDNFICTSSEVTNVLQGDSGGPLVCKNTGDPNDKGQGVIVGVVSGAAQKRRKRRRGFRNENKGFNTFFTRVTSYQGFVRGNDATINLPLLYIVCISLIISHFC